MCTGAEIPAAMTAAMAGTSAAAAVPAAAGTAAGLGAGATAAGLGAGAGEGGLLAASPMLASLVGLDSGPFEAAAMSPAALSAAGTDAAAAAPATAGLSAQFGNPGIVGGSTYPDASSGELASVGQTHNPLYYQAGGSSTGGPNSGLMGAYDSAKPYLDKGMNAYGNYNKAQSAMGLMNGPRPMQAGAPMSMTNKANQQQTPFAQQFGPGPGAQQMPDAAKMMILKRMGLLGGM